MISTATLLYNDKHIIGRLFRYFSVYFSTFATPTAESLFLLILVQHCANNSEYSTCYLHQYCVVVSQQCHRIASFLRLVLSQISGTVFHCYLGNAVLALLAMESADSIRSLYRHFLSGITSKSLNAFYYACSYAKVDYSAFMNVTTGLALRLIPADLKSQPVFLCIDDTMVSKFGKKFEDVSKLFDHAAHNGSNYLNGHCFVSLMLCVPVWSRDRISYLAVPLGYRMWQKKESKLEPASAMVRQVMPGFSAQRNVIILCDSWYVKQNLVPVVDEYENPDLIGNARADSVIYDLAPRPTGRKGRPAKHGRRLSIESDFVLSGEKVGDYYTGCRRVLTNIFGAREVMAYVISTGERKRHKKAVFQYCFSYTDAGILCLAGKSAAEPGRKRKDAIYPLVPVFVPMEH